MNCAEIRTYLTAYLDHEVTQDERRVIQAHLSRCPECSAELVALAETQRQLKLHLQAQAAALTAPPDAWQTLQARLQRPAGEQKSTHSARLPRAARRWSMVALAALVLALAMLLAAPKVRAQVDTWLETWFHFSSNNNQNYAAMGGFDAFHPLHAAQLPDDFQLSIMGNQTSPDFEAVELTYSREGDFITLLQREGPGVPPLPGGQAVEVRGQAAVFVPGFAAGRAELLERMPNISTDTGLDYRQVNLLAWQEGERRVELLSNLPLEQILPVATGLAPMQTGQGTIGTSQERRPVMLSMLIIWLFGWPGISLSFILTLVGVWRRRMALCLLGALLAVPFAYYLGGQPAIGWPGFALPVLPLLSGLSLPDRNRYLAWIPLVPFAAILLWVLILVFS